MLQIAAVPSGISLLWLGRVGGAIRRRSSPIRWTAYVRTGIPATVIRSLCVVVLFSACTSSPDAHHTHMPGCEHPPALQYYHRIKEATLAAWMPPGGTPFGANVTIRFRLDDLGRVAESDVVEASSPDLGATALGALRAASPFGAPPEPECVVGKSLIATFTIPAGES